MLYYKHSIPPTCLSRSYDRPQGRPSQKDGSIKILQKIVNQYTVVK